MKLHWWSCTCMVSFYSRYCYKAIYPGTFLMKAIHFLINIYYQVLPYLKIRALQFWSRNFQSLLHHLLIYQSCTLQSFLVYSSILGYYRHTSRLTAVIMSHEAKYSRMCDHYCELFTWTTNSNWMLAKYKLDTVLKNHSAL